MSRSPDLRSSSHLILERPDVAYSLLAVDFMSESALHAALSRVASGVARGQLRPLPQVAYGLPAVQAALRQMSQARHVGKIVVRAPALQYAQCTNTACAWVVAGGLGTLGVQVAEWLARQRVRSLCLLGRSGRYVEGVAVDMLRPGGAAFQTAVTLAMCDTASTESTANLQAAFASSMVASGVVHAGGVLADGVLMAQTLASLRTVFAPKVNGSMRLAEVTQTQPAAVQLLFSSVAALLGSPGQTNYSAANATLDAMSSGWQARGVMSSSLQWGAWAGAGMAASDASTASRVERTGMALLEPSRGLAVLSGLLLRPEFASPVVSANAFHWDRFMRRLAAPGVGVPRMFAEFAEAVGADAEAAGRGTTCAITMATASSSGGGAEMLTPAERQAMLLSQVQDAVRGILGSSVGDEEPLMSAGLDSLGAGALLGGSSLPLLLTFLPPGLYPPTEPLFSPMPTHSGAQEQPGGSAGRHAAWHAGI